MIKKILKDYLHTLKKCSGFTLAELAILMTVLSLVGISAIVSKKNMIGLDKKIKTTERLERIEKALSAHHSKYGYYPCPAQGGLAINAASFGQEKRDSLDSCIAVASNIYATGDSPDVFIGVVPVKNLGLSYNEMMDGYGNRIMYAVSNAATRLFTPCPSPDSNIIILYDYDSSQDLTYNITNNSSTSKASYVLMSMGKDGVGAFPFGGGGSRNAPISTASGTFIDSVQQQQNHHYHTSVSSFDKVFIKPNVPLDAGLASVKFDDRIVYGMGVANCF